MTKTLASQIWPHAFVEVRDYASLVDAISKFGGTKEIRMVKPIALEDQLLIDTLDNFVLTGLGRYTTLTLKAGSVVLGKTPIQVTDSNDIILDDFGLNCAGQTVGDGINLLRVRRSSFGSRFLRVDNAFQHGINNNGSGAYPNSNVVNVFGNIYLYTCAGYGFYEGGFAGDDVIERAYIQECLLGGLYEGGVHLQVMNAHIHECLYGIRNSTHDCYHGHINVEGSDNDGIRIDGGGGSQGMKNHFDQVFLFDNNQSSGANYSDIRCVGATAKWNTFNRIHAMGYSRVKYNYSDHAVTGSGNTNRVHVLTSQDWVTAQSLLCTDGGSESIIDRADITS